MSHTFHTIDGINKDINPTYPDREAYLKLTEGFLSKLRQVHVESHDGIIVVREDLLETGGSKARAGEFLFSTIKEDVVCYVVPRCGHAGYAIANLAKIYGKKVVFFMPSCKEISEHQKAAIEIDSVNQVQFHRIAAMPNLNRIAKKWAEENGAYFIPFGLNHPYTIAGYVRICEYILKNYDAPEVMWTVVSTGVLTRGLQIGFPNTKMKGVAVARNMKAGELGRTDLISEPLDFTREEKYVNLPPFNTVKTYDGKGYKYVLEYKKQNPDKRVWFWNVAGELKSKKEFKPIDSYCEWGQFKTYNPTHE